MRRLQVAQRHRHLRQDDGIALVAVLGVMSVLTAFLLVILATALQNLSPTRADQDAKTAMAAAEAGVEEYVSRLNANDSYWTTGNTDTANPAFSAAGVSVPGAAGSTARFRYQLVSSPAEVSKTGQIRLRVTGTSKAHQDGKEVQRSLTATLQPAGFLDFVYMSDIESLDPVLYRSSLNARYATYNGNAYAKSATGSTGGQTTATNYRYIVPEARIEQDCAKYYYAGRSNRQYTASSTVAASADAVLVYDTVNKTIATLTTSSQLGRTVAGYSCTEIQFTSGDVINGPLHSNDALQVNGSTLFTRPRTESSWPMCQSSPSANCWWGTGTPRGASNDPPGYWPRFAQPIAMPPGNEELLKYVEPRIDVPGAAPGPGCLYKGITRITFVGDKMKIFSPNTTSAPDRCLTVGTRNQEQTKNIPPVIYVDTAAAPCSGVGYPVTGESLGVGYTTDYSCTNGTAIVKGAVKGQVTVNAVNDVVIAGDLVRDDREPGSTDVVGLIAGNNVWVYHPVNSSGANLLTVDASVHDIEAAILSLRHSFIVQNYDKGSALTINGDTKLNVTGAIAQRHRGPVGTGNGTSASTGYLKNYVYDDRLTFLQPPYFLKPSASPWITKKISDG